MSWYEEMVAAGRSKSLTTGNIRRGVTAVHEVLGSPALETPVNCHSELMEDPLRNIEPVQLGLGVNQMCQASVYRVVLFNIYKMRDNCTSKHVPLHLTR